MKRVTGIGGIYFKAKDAPAPQAWHQRHLGVNVLGWGGAAFTWADSDGKPAGKTTVWSIGPEEGGQFAPGKASFMVHYRVEDLHAGLGTWIARRETALRAPARKPGGGPR